MLRPAEHHNLNSAVEPQWGATTTKNTLDLRVDSKNILGTSDTGHKEKGATHTHTHPKKKTTTTPGVVLLRPRARHSLTHCRPWRPFRPKLGSHFCVFLLRPTPTLTHLGRDACGPGGAFCLLRPRRTRRANKNNVWPTTSGLETTRRGNSQKKKHYFLTSKP